MSDTGDLEGRVRVAKYQYMVAGRDYAAIDIANYLVGICSNCRDNVLKAKIEKFEEMQESLEGFLKKEAE